ncbi:hypothetical protein M433DRAFT_143534 [Acidomyces richmondensis BFW]|nr:hypothetical protein M433DRAFT_143534 [Acidomyces richmondensis BFW]
MSRIIKIAAAQVGQIHRGTQKEEVVTRLIRLLNDAGNANVQLVVFPECILMTFFPRSDITQSQYVKQLFDESRSKKIDIVLGYAERTTDGIGYNTCVSFSANEGKVISKYRKVHLPDTKDPFVDPHAINKREKRYFTPGNLGFPAFWAPGLISGTAKMSSAQCGENTVGKGDPIFGMISGAELVMFGFNTGSNMAHLWGSKPMSSKEAEQEALFHSILEQQSNRGVERFPGAIYMHACFSISSARCGLDDGKYDLIGGSAIVNLESHIIAQAKTKEDELVVAVIDLAECRQGKRIEAYRLIETQTGVVEPELM